MSKPSSNVARAFLPAKDLSGLQDSQKLRLFLVPCSCGTTFAVPEKYDQQGTQWSRFLICPNCGKRHDPRNRLLHLGYHREGYWKVDDC